MWDPWAKFEKVTLDNGIDLYHLYWNYPEANWLFAGFSIHSGAKHDPEGKEGCAHFLEHLISRNVAHYSRREICDYFQSVGGKCTLGETYCLKTTYDFFVPCQEDIVRESLRIFGPMLLGRHYLEDKHNQRAVVLEEFDQDYPVEALVALAQEDQKNLYRDHWLSRSVNILGYPESINAITMKDINEYRDAYYTPRNLSIVMVGGLSLDRAVRLLKESQFNFASGGVRTPVLQPLATAWSPLPINLERKLSDYIPNLKSGVYSTKAILPGTLNADAVHMVQEIAEQMLFDDLRERRGWTYAIHTGFTQFGDVYKWEINVHRLNRNGLKSIARIVDKVIEEVSNATDLFERKKAGEMRSRELTDISGRRVGELALKEVGQDQCLTTKTKDLEDLSALSMQDIRDVAACLKPENRYTVLGEP